jgi:hypothetical protein
MVTGAPSLVPSPTSRRRRVIGGGGSGSPFDEEDVDDDDNDGDDNDNDDSENNDDDSEVEDKDKKIYKKSFRFGSFVLNPCRFVIATIVPSLSSSFPSRRNQQNFLVRTFQYFQVTSWSSVQSLFSTNHKNSSFLSTSPFITNPRRKRNARQVHFRNWWFDVVVRVAVVVLCLYFVLPRLLGRLFLSSSSESSKTSLSRRRQQQRRESSSLLPPRPQLGRPTSDDMVNALEIVIPRFAINYEHDLGGWRSHRTFWMPPPPPPPVPPPPTPPPSPKSLEDKENEDEEQDEDGTNENDSDTSEEEYESDSYDYDTEHVKVAEEAWAFSPTHHDYHGIAYTHLGSGGMRHIPSWDDALYELYRESIMQHQGNHVSASELTNEDLEDELSENGCRRPNWLFQYSPTCNDIHGLHMETDFQKVPAQEESTAERSGTKNALLKDENDLDSFYIRCVH